MNMTKELKVTYSIILFIILTLFISTNDVKCEENNIVVDLKGNEILLDSLTNSEQNILFLINNYNCYPCISKTLDSLELIGNISVIIISRTNNSILARKNFLKKYKDQFSNFQVYFDKHNSELDWPPNPKDGIFGKHNIKVTPALVFYSTKSKEQKYLGSTSLEGEIENVINETKKMIN